MFEGVMNMLLLKSKASVWYPKRTLNAAKYNENCIFTVFSFKPNLVSKVVATFFSKINPGDMMNFVNLQEKNMNLLCLELGVSISSEVCSLA